MASDTNIRTVAAVSRILVAEDEEVMRDFISEVIECEGFSAVTTSNCDEALNALRKEAFDLLITDVRMPGGSGLNIVEFVRREHPATGVLVITGYPDDELVRRGEELEISSFLVKPFSQRQLKYAVLAAMQKRKAVIDTGAGAPAGSQTDNLGLVGVSQYYTGLRRKIHQLAGGDFPILVQGPSGTGKEIIARAVHSCSSRQDKPLITINCAAIPKHLEESEFFGHAKGSFTGAHSLKHGIIASADGSTLFLDEIGELTPETQAKLLRVLDTGEFLRIGEVVPQKVDIRIVSATNRDLSVMVEEGTFRKDLFFRLRGGMIATAALSENREDVPALVNHFLHLHQKPSSPARVTADAMDILVSRPWSGNIRELKHTVALLCATAAGLKRINISTVKSVLRIEEAAAPDENLAYLDAKEQLVRQFEIDYFTKLMQRHNGNVNKAAQAAGMYRPNLMKKLAGLGISADTFRVKKTGKT